MSLIKEKVSLALNYEDLDLQTNAYVTYLESIALIITSLSTDNAKGNGVSVESVKLARLGKQCMDRITVLASSIHSTHPAPPTVAQAPTSPPGDDVIRSPTSGRFDMSGADNYSSLPVNLTENANTSTRPPSTAQTHRQLSNLKMRSPLELARRQNQAMLAAYKSRTRSANQQSAANMSLSLHRKMAENLSVAKAKEESLARKMQERHRRMTEEAKRSLEWTQGMSRDELERRQLYMRVLQYEHNSAHLLSWREKLKAGRENTQLIESLIRYILSLTDHPVTQLLYKYQYATYDKLQPLLQRYKKHSETPRQTTPSDAENRTMMSCSDTASVPSDTCDDTSLNTHPSSDSLSSTEQSFLPSETLGIVAQHTVDSSQSDNIQSPSNEVIDQISIIDNPESNEHEDKETSEYDSNIGSRSGSQSSDLARSGSRDSDRTRSDSQDSGMTRSESGGFEKKDSTAIELEEGTLEELQTQALTRHLQNIVQDVQHFLEKLQVMFIVAYPDLNSAAGKDLCYACLEQPFFKPVWPYVIMLFRLVHRAQETSLAQRMTSLTNCSPTALGVTSKFALSDPVPSKHAYAYEPAVQELRTVRELASPLCKLEAIVRASKLIVRCIEEHYQALGQVPAPNIGADDLLPVLSYCVVRSQLPELCSECQALEQFIHEGYLMGEEGYCLTSLQTAISFIINRLGEL